MVQGYPLYVFDGLPGGPKPGSQVRPFPVESYWTSAFSSIDRKVFVVLDADEAPAEPRKWVRKVVYRNPWEKTVICEIDIKAGQRALEAIPRGSLQQNIQRAISMIEQGEPY